MSDRCTWCGTEVEGGDGYRAYEPAGSRRAVFCRLEHVVPWAIRGAWWEPGPPVDDPRLTVCSFCGDPLGEAHVLLVRSRGEHSVDDAFCGVAHLLEWAKAGGRYR
jgi:ribosomal protein L24E